MSRRRRTTPDDWLWLLALTLLCLCTFPVALVVAALGFYGPAVAVVGAVLAFYSPSYRSWLTSQPGYLRRLSRLPGLRSTSPAVLAIATLVYLLPISAFCWFMLIGLLPHVRAAGITAVIGLIGMGLLYGWFIRGWRIPFLRRYSFGHVKRLDQIKSLDPIDFERFVGDLFEHMGYTVQTTARTGDEGIDLYLRKGNKTAIVQCKRYDGTVGQSVVRDLRGAMVHSGADEAYLVTTGTFSLPARSWATSESIHLIDGNELLEWIDALSAARSTGFPLRAILREMAIHKLTVGIGAIAALMSVCPICLLFSFSAR